MSTEFQSQPSERLPKWAIIETWTEDPGEECITTFMHYKRDATALARFWNGTTEDLTYRVEPTEDALKQMAALGRERSSR